jgi:pyruvate/2-oxoglutarate dehydrogenase complex dihydrolipoamide dehydrogenase (E3) component
VAVPDSVPCLEGRTIFQNCLVLRSPPRGGLAGTCVIVGCIPSKALLQPSEHFEFTRLHAVEHGFTIGDLRLDLAPMMKRKDDVVAQNTSSPATSAAPVRGVAT